MYGNFYYNPFQDEKLPNNDINRFQCLLFFLISLEIRDYAIKIGINPGKEPHLLHLARDGLMRALPNDWKPWYEMLLEG